MRYHLITNMRVFHKIETSFFCETIACIRQQAKVTIEVCDNGPGIPEPIKDKIFEPFFTSKEVGKGTGLGLSISYGIIRECGGRIQAVSRNNLGTCFVIHLPVLK